LAWKIPDFFGKSELFRLETEISATGFMTPKIRNRLTPLHETTTFIICPIPLVPWFVHSALSSGDWFTVGVHCRWLRSRRNGCNL